MQGNDKYTSAVQNAAAEYRKLIGGCGLLDPAYLRGIDQRLQAEVYSLLQSPKPKIMVYGIYNSGKSTMVNALCEKAVAEVADRPMTCRVDEYDAGKYILIDSPGVDAPMEHERIADSQLNKCHIILFVISSKGGFESRRNYEKMLQLIDLDIPFYIILNDRGVPLPKDPEQRKKAQISHTLELDRMKRKIIRNLITYSGDQNIGDRYEVIVLNAKRAWIGVEKGNPQIIEASGISVLRSRIEQILEDGKALQWLQTPIATLDHCVGETEEKLIALQGGSDYAMERQALQVKTDSMREAMVERLRDCVYSKREEMYTICLAGKSGEFIGDAVLHDIEEAYRQELGKLRRCIQERFPNLVLAENGGLRVQGQVVIGSPNQEARAYDPGAFHSSVSSDVMSEPESGSFLSVISQAVKGQSVIPPLIKLITEKLKSREKREMEKLHRLQEEAELANRRVEDRVAEESRRRQDARTQTNEILDGLYREIRSIMLPQMEEYIAEIRQSLDIAAQEKQQRSAAVQQLLDQLRSLRNQLAGLRQMLM